MGTHKASEDILRACALLHAKNMLAACDGNLSIKLPDGNILITPSGRPKAFLEAHDMALLSPDGRTIKGTPTSETIMHLSVYATCPKARAVVHAHPPHLIAWGIARPEDLELPCEHLSELILGVGGVPFVPYARPGTHGMGEVLVPFLEKGHRALALRHHGALSWGEDLEEAMNGMERMEHSAQCLKIALDMGNLSCLPEREIEAFRKMFKERGGRSR